MKRITNIIATLAGVLALATGCDKTYVNEIIASAPVIESFSPQSAPVGAEIIITGQHLNNVKQAFIGNAEMVIKERVSDTRISILAGANGSTGKIRLINEVGSTESNVDFTYSYAVPELTASLLPQQVEMGGEMLLAGNNLSAVKEVLFTAPGYLPHSAEIREQSAREIIVRVPYVEEDAAAITLVYFNGTGDVATSSENAPQLAVKRDKPVFNAITFERTAVGRTVTLTGEYMNKVDQILVNGFEAFISKEPTTLTFTVPAGDFADGETETTVEAVYFDGNESVEVGTNKLLVFVPFVKFWENITTYCQSREVETFSAFFSPETGRAYANSEWSTLVDPISFQYSTAVCTAANTTNQAVVSEADYYSVNPYFFFSGVSAGNIQLNGPANSNGQIKNFFKSATSGDANRILEQNVSAYGTPVMAYRYLSPANAEENKIIEMVKNQTLEHIDEETFPIDVANNTVAGIGITSCEGTTNTSKWAVGTGFEIGKPADNIQIDAVIMVFYYGYGQGGVKDHFAENIRRIGFVHIVKLNHRLDSGNGQPTRSDVTFNCYWQKYDYDYSKVK